MAKNKNWYIEKYGIEEGTKRYNIFIENVGKSSKDKNTLNGFIKRYGKELGEEKYNLFVNKSKQTKENFIKRYGEEDGILKWEFYKNKHIKGSKRRKEYWLNCGYNELESIQKVKEYQNKCSLKSYIQRYGEEKGKELYYIKNNRHSYNMSLDGYVERYGEKNGTLKYNNALKRRQQDLNGYIERYGEKEGYIKYKKRNKSVSHTLHNYIKWYGETYGKEKWEKEIEKKSLYKPSKKSLKYFIAIYKWLRKNKFKRKDIYWGIKGSKEYYLYENKNKNIFWYDFTIPKIKLIIEYNGEHVHPNKDVSKKEWEKWKHAYTKKSADEVYEYDKYKLDVAIENGYSVIVIWSKTPLSILNLKEKIGDIIKKQEI